MYIKIDAERKCMITYDIQCKPHAHSNYKPSINCLLMERSGVGVQPKAAHLVSHT